MGHHPESAILYVLAFIPIVHGVTRAVTAERSDGPLRQRKPMQQRK
jgi:hypothetical protein